MKIDDNLSITFDELAYYTKNVNHDLKEYISNHIFPEYDKNDGAHNILSHIRSYKKKFYCSPRKNARN